MVDALARERRVRLMTDLPRILPALIADERACRQILINLVSNAVKFSHEGGAVTVSMKRQGTFLNISVTDRGIGMGEEAVRRIGEPFFQAQDGLSRRYEGTGLGLVDRQRPCRAASRHPDRRFLARRGDGCHGLAAPKRSGNQNGGHCGGDAAPSRAGTSLQLPQWQDERRKSVMSSAVVASLPFQAGDAVALAAGKGLFWAYSHFMRQPLRNAGLAGMIGLSTMAGSNALYFQAHRHPAPLFGVQDAEMEVADAAPAVPPVRPKTLKLTTTDTTTTGSVKAPAATPAAAPIGNAEVFELQRKLQGLGLFDATVDGLYGPRTARAIKAFEERQGLKPLGQLTQEIVDLILSTSIVAPAPKIEPLPTPDPLPTAKAKVETPELIVDSLPSPQPLADLPDEASAEATMGDAIDSILDGVSDHGDDQTERRTRSASFRPSPSRPSPRPLRLSPSVPADEAAVAVAVAPVSTEPGSGDRSERHRKSAARSRKPRLPAWCGGRGCRRSYRQGHPQLRGLLPLRRNGPHHAGTGRSACAERSRDLGSLMLRTDLWVAAFVRRHNDIGHICVIAQRGDPIAGQIFIEIDHLNGTVSLLTPAPATAREEGNADRLFSLRFSKVEPEAIRAASRASETSIPISGSLPWRCARTTRV